MPCSGRALPRLGPGSGEARAGLLTTLLVVGETCVVRTSIAILGTAAKMPPLASATSLAPSCMHSRSPRIRTGLSAHAGRALATKGCWQRYWRRLAAVHLGDIPIAQLHIFRKQSLEPGLVVSVPHFEVLGCERGVIHLSSVPHVRHGKYCGEGGTTLRACTSIELMGRGI